MERLAVVLGLAGNIAMMHERSMPKMPAKMKKKMGNGDHEMPMKGWPCHFNYSYRSGIHNSRGGPAAPPSVRKKTKILIHEGETPEQAYAMAWSMKRAGRLTKEGGYRRVKKG